MLGVLAIVLVIMVVALVTAPFGDLR